MTEKEKNAIRDLFFKLKPALDKSPITRKETLNALRIDSIIKSTAMEFSTVDSVYFAPALYKGNNRIKEFSNPLYRRVFLEIRDHDRLYRYLEKRAERHADLTVSLLLKAHKILFETSWPDIAGRIRNIDVRIRGIHHKPPHNKRVYELMYQHFGWIDGLLKLIGPANPSNFFEIFHIATDVQRRIIQTYPFQSGNWRIARAFTDYILLYCGLFYCTIDYTNRDDYLIAHDNASMTEFKDLEDFLLMSFGETLSRVQNYIGMEKQPIGLKLE